MNPQQSQSQSQYTSTGVLSSSKSRNSYSYLPPWSIIRGLCLLKDREFPVPVLSSVPYTGSSSTLAISGLPACWLRACWVRLRAPGSTTCAPMMRPAAVPLLVLCQIVSQLCAGRAEDVVTVTDASWASTIESEAAEWMVEFYAPWVRTAAFSSIPYCSRTPPDVRVRA